MSMMKTVQPKAATQVPEPPIARFLFADTRMAWFWLIVRVYVGFQWLAAGFDKLTGYSITPGKTFGMHVGNSWIFTNHLGAVLTGFLQGAVTPANIANPATGWYVWFVQHLAIPGAGLFTYLVTFGELAVGLGLIFGVLTGIAAFFGLFMNLNFMLAGAISINPIIGGLALFLVLAWRVAGYYGGDRYLLPLLGTPWTGTLAHTTTPPVTAAPPRVPVLN